ncbi:MAG: 4Fe-4S binding protein [Chloroflexi bacterium]|nr:4Fe-4S binding protein [Chloroflexota bacterium]
MEGLKAELRRESRRLRLDFNELKSGGFIKQTQKDLFTVRLRCPGGQVTADKLHLAADIAQRFGRGEVHLSVRQSVEIPYVHYQHFDAITEELKTVNWSVASCGPRVRVPTACAGCTYNPNGLVDTQSMCREVDRRYFGIPTGHHKFKISFSGCPIDCFRSREMDLGFQGVVEPKLVEELCTGCELCVKNCEDEALRMEGSLPVRDLDKCIWCGDCVKICPVDAMVVDRRGWLARVGGKHGKHPLFAYEVANFLSDDQAFSLIEATLGWYRSQGRGRERIGATIARLGLEQYIQEVIHPLGGEAIESPQERRRYWAEGNLYGLRGGEATRKI